MMQQTNKTKRLDEDNGVKSFAVLLFVLGIVVGLVLSGFSFDGWHRDVFLICTGSGIFASAIFFSIAAIVDRQNEIIKLLRGPEIETHTQKAESQTVNLDPISGRPIKK